MADRTGELVGEVARELDARRLTLAVAESCTGGSLAAAITDLAGVSSFFLGGVVSYANEVKMALLDVPEATLHDVGAVSEPIARAMAEGVRKRLSADIGVGITGVAGPGGGTVEKPVGLVFIGVAAPGGTEVRRDVWPGTRGEIRSAAVQAALEMIQRAAQQAESASTGDR
jgi:PncC family amidohydrolase